MKITKAIEILTYASKHNTILYTPDEKDALKLGIEALTFLERWRAKAEIQPFPLLPSETT